MSPQPGQQGSQSFRRIMSADSHRHRDEIDAGVDSRVARRLLYGRVRTGATRMILFSVSALGSFPQAARPDHKLLVRIS